MLGCVAGVGLRDTKLKLRERRLLEAVRKVGDKLYLSRQK